MRTVIFAVLLGAACAASAQLYRWTDEQGRTHLTDTPPPPTAKNVKRRSPGAPDAGVGENQPYSLQVAAKNFPVTLFTAPDCPPCGTARSLLNARGVPFQEVSVVDQRQREQLQQAVGSLSVPSIRVGSSVQKGFEQGAYDSLLDSAGYPRAGILPPRHQIEPRPAPPKPAAASDEAAEEPTAGPYKPR